MNGTYEIEYHTDTFLPCEREVVTVDGRSQRNNRTPVPLIEYARAGAQRRMAWRFRIHAIKPCHITATKATPTTAYLVFEEKMEHHED